MVGLGVKVTLVPLQICDDGFAEILTLGVTDEFTDIVMLLLVAVVGEAQLAFDVSTQVITFPFASEEAV